jgi:hypothetical protein
MTARISMKLFVMLALAVAIGLAFAVSPYASSSPDGLSRVAEQEGFVGNGRLHAIQDDAPIPGYAFPGIHDERLAKGVAGFVGTLTVFSLGYGLAWVLRRQRPRHGGGGARAPSAG